MSNCTNVSLASAGRTVSRSLLGLGLLAGAAASQTWMVDVEDGDVDALGLAVAPDGRIAVLRDSVGAAGVTLFDAGGQVLNSYDLAPFSGGDLTVRAGVFVDDGGLALCGSLDDELWVGEVEASSGLAEWARGLAVGSDVGSFDQVLVNDLGHLVLHARLFDVSATQLYSFVADVNPATDGGLHYRRDFRPGSISSMVETQNGDLVMGAYANGNTLVTRTSNWGNPIWRHELDGAVGMAVPSVVETTSGDLMGLGLQGSTTPGYQFVAFKTDATGNLIWNRQYETFPGTQFGKIHEVFDAVPTLDGGLVASVTQPLPDGERAAALLRLDADGVPVWLRTLTPLGVDSKPAGLARTPDGGFIVLTRPVDGGSFSLARLNADGEGAGCFTQPTFITQLTSLIWNDVLDPFAYESISSSLSTPQHAPFGHPVTATTICGDTCEVSGGAYGAGTAGTGGLVPQLSASDGFCLGYTSVIELTDIVGAAPGVLFIGFGAGSVMAMGGTFLIDPTLPILSFPMPVGGTPGAAGAGSIAFPLGTDLTPLVGLTLHMQAVFGDPAGPTGKTLTNAATMTIG